MEIHRQMSPLHDEEERHFYGVTPEFVAEVSDHIKAGTLNGLTPQILARHNADIGDLIDQLEPAEQEILVEKLAGSMDPEVLTYLSDATRAFLIPLLGTKVLAGALRALDSDDAVLLISDLEPEQQRQLLRALSSRDRARFEESLTFPEETAGRLMQREIVCVPASWTVKQVITLIKADKHLPSNFYSIFVVDTQHHPIGRVPLSELLRAGHTARMSDLMHDNVHIIPAMRDEEDVAGLFQHYGLTSAPVVDEEGRVIGMITVDDIVEVIEEKAEQDILHMAGVSSSDFGLGCFETFARRAPWLVATMFNGIITALVIQQFEPSLSALTALSFFMPLPAMMGGNVGLQVMTVIIRAMAARDLREQNTAKALRKEVSVGFLNGLLFSTLLGVFAYWFTGGNWQIGLVLFGALLWNIVWAAIAGCLLPVMMQRAQLDPTVGAGPILTVITDILGYAIYLMLASVWLL